MTMDVAAIRDGLKARLATVSGLRCHDTIPTSVTPPCAVVAPAEPFIDYQQAMNGGLCVLHFKVILIAGSVSDRSGQDTLDGYLSAGTGETTSVLDAIHADRTLGGVVSDCQVDEAGDYGFTEIPAGSGTQFVKADLHLRVLVGRQ